MATIRERLTEFAKEQGLKSLSGLEKKCGFTKNTLTKDREGISSTTLVKIVDIFPQLSLDWVILNRGEMEWGHTSTIVSGLNSSNDNTSDCYNTKYVEHLEEEVFALRKEKEELWQLIQKLMN